MTSSSNDKNQPLNYYEWRRAMGATSEAYHAYYDAVTAGELPAKVEPRYTRSQVEDALDRAAELVANTHDGYETSDTLLQDDAVNLVVNTAGYLLDHPGAGLDEVIPVCYDDVTLGRSDFEDLTTDEREPERGTPAWNEALVDKVLGWLA